MSQKQKTSWDNVANWYDQIVSKEGHYYHQEVILPHLKEHWVKSFSPSDSLLEFACGQGVFERIIPPSVDYLGLDVSKKLIESAEKQKTSPKHRFVLQDVTLPFQLNRLFDHAIIVLAFQNFKDPLQALKNIAAHLKETGTVVLVLNHPCFRIPRQSSWGIDEQKKIQYRRVDRYLSDLEIPISMQPSKGKTGETTYSYHHPLSYFFSLFQESGFVTQNLVELCSNKASQGSQKKMEDRARNEFPLFMVVTLQKSTKKY